MDIKEQFEKHIRKHKKLFNRYCYIISNDGKEEYEILCTEKKPKDQYVLESKNLHRETIVLKVILNDLKQASNIMNSSEFNCPTEDFSKYKISYRGNNYIVTEVAPNGSFDVIRELHCRLME